MKDQRVSVLIDGNTVTGVVVAHRSEDEATDLGQPYPDDWAVRYDAGQSPDPGEVGWHTKSEMTLLDS